MIVSDYLPIESIDNIKIDYISNWVKFEWYLNQYSKLKRSQYQSDTEKTLSRYVMHIERLSSYLMGIRFALSMFGYTVEELNGEEWVRIKQVDTDIILKSYHANQLVALNNYHSNNAYWCRGVDLVMDNSDYVFRAIENGFTLKQRNEN